MVVSLVSIILSHCIVSFPKPGFLLAGLMLEAGSWTANVGSLLALLVTQGIDGEDAHPCVFRVAILGPRPSILTSCEGEFGDGRLLLLGLSNIRSPLHCLLPQARPFLELVSW
jgi:hypothetical protein